MLTGLEVQNRSSACASEEGEWSPVQPDAEFRLMLPDYIGKGGDTYAVEGQIEREQGNLTRLRFSEIAWGADGAVFTEHAATD